VPTSHDPLIDRFVEACEADDRIVASFLVGSLARERADEFSDVDLCVIARDVVFDDVVRDRASLIEPLGVPVFVEDFGHVEVVSFVLADGTEAEIFFGRESALDELRPGRYRPLFDPHGILDDVTFDEERTDPADLEAALRQSLSWFWHELSHFVKAIGRNQLWWAAGQLEALRNHCVNIARIEQGVLAGDEPYWKLDDEVRTAAIEPLEATFVPMERDALLAAGRIIVSFFRERAPRLAAAYGLPYPADLANVMVKRLDDLPGGSDP
jgi:predicted nucleotidyltransferase